MRAHHIFFYLSDVPEELLGPPTEHPIGQSVSLSPVGADMPSYPRQLKEIDMTSTVHPTVQNRGRMDSLRKTSMVAGVLYLLTFISIPTLALYRAVRTDPNFIAGTGPDTAIILGGVLEIIVALACIGTGVALYPVIKRQNEGVALGFVSARVLEAATIFAGVVAILAIVSLRQAGAGQDAVITGQALLSLHTWTTLFGQGFLPAVNALLLGSLMYKARLVPRILPLLGFIGAPVLVASVAGVLFGIWEPVNALGGIGALLLALWEFSLGVWLVVKGFKPSAITAGMTASSTPAGHRQTV
jgi:hypothetical protein